jgi:hypothetical protein
VVLRGFAFASVLALLAPIAALAQDDQPPPAEDSASASAAPDDQTIEIRGRVSAFDGVDTLVVRDEQGYLVTVSLHEGTVVNPAGLTLAPGMIVSVVGYNAGSSVGANEIDTPYAIYGGTPFFDGNPWTYSDPDTSLDIFFASPVWWHGAYFSGGYRFVDGQRYWGHLDNAHFYHGGYFRGHAYIVSSSRGGWTGHGDPRVLSHSASLHSGAGRLDEGRSADRGLAPRAGGNGRPFDARENSRNAAPGEDRPLDNRGMNSHGAVDIHGRPIDAHADARTAAPGASRPLDNRGMSGGQAVDIHGRPIDAHADARTGAGGASRALDNRAMNGGQPVDIHGRPVSAQNDPARAGRNTPYSRAAMPGTESPSRGGFGRAPAARPAAAAAAKPARESKKPN